MSLIVCPECGKKYSNSNAKCIHCGYAIKLADQSRQLVIRSMAVMIISVLLTLVIPFVYVCDVQEYKETGDTVWQFDSYGIPRYSYPDRDYVSIIHHGSSLLISDSVVDGLEIDHAESLVIYAYLTLGLTVFAAAILYVWMNNPQKCTKAWLTPLAPMFTIILQGIIFLCSSMNIKEANASRYGSRRLRVEPQIGFLWWIVIAVLVYCLILNIRAKKRAMKDMDVGIENDDSVVQDLEIEGY